MVYFLLQHPFLDSKSLRSLTLVLPLIQFLCYILYCIIQLVRIPLHIRRPLLLLNHHCHRFCNHPRKFFPSLRYLEFSRDLIPSFLVSSSTISITSWVILIILTLWWFIIFPVNTSINSYRPCSISNSLRYMTPSVLGVVVFIGLVSCISCP